MTDQRSDSKRKSKNGQDRMVPIDSALGEVFKLLLTTPGTQLFATPQNRKLSPKLVRDAFLADFIKPLTEKFPTPKGEIGFEHGCLHNFRHFFVSRAFLCGANEGEIRDWVGHAGSKIVELYRHLAPQEGLRKLESLDIMNMRKKVDGPPL